MQDFLNSIWFSIGQISFSFGDVLLSLAYVIFCILLYWYLVNNLLSAYLSPGSRRRREALILRRNAINITILGVLLGLLLILDLDRVLIESRLFTLRISNVLTAGFIFTFARAIDLLFSQIVVHRVYDRRDALREVADREAPSKERVGKMAQWIVYLIAIILVLTTFDINLELFSLPADAQGDKVIPIRISNILTAILVLLIARLISWVLTEIVLHNYYQRANVDIGSQYAFNQLLKYVLYTIAILMAIDQLGVNTTLLLGGLAALLVGIGLGLQQTFNDFFSGVILLFERSVEIGDVLEVDGLVGTVKKIGMRASQVETRENITVVVPNSKLVSQSVINWSHFDDKVRFIIPLPVPHTADPRIVREILIKAAKESAYVLDQPLPFTRLTNFTNSSLDFELHFWSRHFIIIEDVKSDLRVRVWEMFREAGIRIPYQQMDVWMRKDQA